ncbi:hypothetical protein [Nonlabens sp. Asnod3-A02]|uniref:hypothetical protein n=1 Tax=Nonlabens sp. Asnod3-A02 TaxID=3160579 RepID=UPI00386D25FB
MSTRNEVKQTINANVVMEFEDVNIAFYFNNDEVTETVIVNWLEQLNGFVTVGEVLSGCYGDMYHTYEDVMYVFYLVDTAIIEVKRLTS